MTSGIARNNTGENGSKGLTLSGMTFIVKINENVVSKLSDHTYFNLTADVSELFIVTYTNNTSGSVYAVGPNGNILDKVGDNGIPDFYATAASYSDPLEVVILSGNWTLIASISGLGNIHFIVAIS
ncbi:hypothetical protein Thermo_02062 [Thermoplasmatales archaeon]|nr:hypothetical protein Thermo_02062 [Thermoplasmatales archaeon]